MKTSPTETTSRRWPRSLAIGLGLCLALVLHPAEPGITETKGDSIDVVGDSDQARISIQANIKGGGESRPRSVYGALIFQTVHASLEHLRHTISIKVDAIQGGLGEVTLALSGEGDVKKVTGKELEDWSVRQGTNGSRWLVLRARKTEPLLKTLTVEIAAETVVPERSKSLSALTLTLEQPTLANGYVRLAADHGLDVHLKNPIGLVPVEASYLPENFQPKAGDLSGTNSQAYRFLGTAYSLPLELSTADPEARRVVLGDFRLVGQLGDDTTTFTLTAVARVKNPRGASIDLLSGRVALTELASGADWRLRYERGRYIATFDRAGEFPLRIKFNAGVRLTNGWNQIDFTVGASALQPVALQSLKADTQFRLAGAARPERVGDEFVSFLPPGGRLNLAWKESRPEAEGALFFAAELLAQVTISPGVMRQTSLMDFKVMQGELNRVTLRLSGDGEVIRVQGPQVLSWTVEPVANSADRRLTVQFNQAQKNQVPIQIQTQTPLGAFPLATNVVQIQPEGATRFGGHYRIVNEGAVRLEVLEASGLSQISPEQFPQTDAIKALPPVQSTQVFAYRFSGDTLRLRIQADNILPELAVSQVLAFHLGETETAIDAEIELDVREAPLRELLLRVPKGYAVARLNASGLSDYFLSEVAEEPDARLRLVYAAPVSGRQVVQLRLERNGSPGAGTWILPRLEVAKAKSSRGHLAVRSDPGFRLTPVTTQGLTEISTAFFPRKLPGIQAAFRLSDPAWQASINVERLPQSVQADAFHLFSVGEGIAYGSTLMNYLISGAPMAAFRVALTNEYFNVEFTGKDVRNWQKVDGGYLVQLHTPVSGAYTLLATYERPFKAQGETLRFSGAQPLDAQSEQGHSIVVSTHQFQVQPVNVSAGLVRLEPGEVPAEYRLFFDAPILAAYRYTARPYNLQLELKPLMQGETVSQVVDRAVLISRISKEGQVVTEARYFVKNKGAPNLSLSLPNGMQLWSVTINGNTVVPVTAGTAHLIPLPQQADPNSVNDLQVKIASRAGNARRLTVAVPRISAPVLLSEWRIEAEAGQRLLFRRGTLTPEKSGGEVSGFAGLLRLLRNDPGGRATMALGSGLLLLALAIWMIRVATAGGADKFGARHLLGGLLGLIGFAGGLLLLAQLVGLAASVSAQPAVNLRFLAAIQQPDTALTVEVSNLPLAATIWSQALTAWPAVVAIALWGYAAVALTGGLRRVVVAGGWTLIFWATLRAPNGAPVFFAVAVAFVVIELLLPAARQWRAVPRKPTPAPPEGSAPQGSAAVAASIAVLVLVGGFGGINPPGAQAQAVAVPLVEASRGQAAPATRNSPLAESVVQEIRVQDDFVFGTARIRWPAIAGQVLPLLQAPGVLTKIVFPPDTGRLVQSAADSGHAFVAEKSGLVELTLDYQLPVIPRDGERGFALPVRHGLVNQMRLTLTGADADLNAPEATSIVRVAGESTNRTLFDVVLAPTDKAWIGWRPRSRDTRREKPVFYAELVHLFVPSAGVVEGLHEAQIRPAQGELNELVLNVPSGLTITDVVAPVVSLWRFDPAARRLRIGLTPAQSKPFAVRIKSQTATGPLPVQPTLGLLSLENAAGEVGLLGLATGAEVQLDDVTSGTLSPINLEDFPAAMVESLRGQVSGLTLRRAYRYSNPQGAVTLKASAVEPDVRVESQQTISLGEDRTVLAANLTVVITRAGIFKMSFALPPTFDVESISGAALSHWTELKVETNRLITLHLKSRTDGAQQFAIGLTAPGVRATNGWSVPRLLVREAGKQRGQLLVVPEQGLRLQVATREAVTQLDPLQSGVRQKGVLAFRLLQSDWKLALDLERVDAWTQVTGLQHIALNEAQLRVTGNLQYEIENAGVKSLFIRLPSNVENLRFRGDQVSDFIPRPPQTNTTSRDWEIKLSRRVSGRFLLQVSYHQPLAPQATNVVVAGIEAQEVNLQRGFVTLQSESRLQVRIDAVPAAIQPAEWQSIPRSLQVELPGLAPSHTFRLVEPGFQLPVHLDRHLAAKLLPARIDRVALASVVSDDGAVLTQARLSLIPGDQQLLRFTLPVGSKFWFAFVGQNSVWPWRENDQILIPLGQHAKTREPVVVEIFYASGAGSAPGRTLDLALVGPRFDLPLENITWRISLNEKWRLRDWGGSLQFQGEAAVVPQAAADVETYVRQEAGVRKEKSREAEHFLSTGNSLLEKGDPEQARRAFQNAFGLSQHDNAFNEDARVQLHNLKTQQAIVGLNVRQAKVAGESGALAATPRNLRDGQQTGYTQQEAKQLLERNSAEDNALQIRLVERLIQQQEATVVNPAAIRASVPEQGRQLNFARSLQVETNTDLRITLSAREVREAPLFTRVIVLTGVLGLVAGFTLFGRGAREL